MDGPRYGTIDADYLHRLATSEDDDPVWMINLMHYRERADYADGRPSDLGGREADDVYAPFGPFAEVGAELVFVADVDTRLLGDTPAWDRIAVVRYPTRRSFVEMQALPEFVELHHHKEAGMASTIVLGGIPIRPTPQVPDPVDPARVPHPSTAEDPEVVALHVLSYVDGGMPDMEAYTEGASTVAGRHGVRVDGWFDVEGTIIGDGRTWHQARFNAFPSREAFMAVVLDPERLEHQRAHREVAIADTYTMILRPTLNRLAASIGG